MSNPENSSPLEQEPQSVVLDLSEDEPTQIQDTAIVEDTKPVPAGEAAPEEGPVDPAVAEKLIAPQYVKVDMDVYAPLKPGEKFDPTKSLLVLPSTVSKALAARIAVAPDMRLNDTPESQAWATALEDGFEMASRNDRFVKALENPNSLWKQKIKTPAGELWGRAPKIEGDEGGVLAGEKGVLRFMQYMGMGTTFKFFLFHTGIWVTLKAPMEDVLLDLNSDIANDKIRAGRDSYGLSFSSMSSYTNERIVNIALSCITAVSLDAKDIPDGKSLRDYIRAHDIPTLIWGLACTVWNAGHQYERACGNSIGSCNALVQAKIDLTKLLWADTNALTEWQLRHMTNHQAGKMKLADVERYQHESLKAQPHNALICQGKNNEANFIFHVPSIGDYFSMSHAWIGQIVQEINRAVGVDNNANERNALISERTRAAWMRQYAHWVKEIQFSGYSIADTPTIQDTLTRLSGQDDVREEFMKAVDEYIETSVMSVLGVPAYDCPKCGKPHVPESDHTREGFKNVLPIDMVKTFFILNVQKVLAIRNRAPMA